jgi:hypothetical protein
MGIRSSGMVTSQQAFKAAEAAARNRPALPAARLVDFHAFLVSDTLGSGAYGTVYRGFFEVGGPPSSLASHLRHFFAEQQRGSESYQCKAFHDSFNC